MKLSNLSFGLFIIHVYFIFSIHLKQEEKLVVVVGRDGGVQTLELHGLVTLRITEEKLGKIKVSLENKDNRGIQLQVLIFVAFIFNFLSLR